MTHFSFALAIQEMEQRFVAGARKVHTKMWQGVDISKKPDMATYELLHPSFSVNTNGYDTDLEALAKDIKPNLPWADDHFLERVCGQPINPGVQWAKWPYGQHAAKFLEAGKFNHNYMERYWPKHAGIVTGPTGTAQEYELAFNERKADLADWCPPNQELEALTTHTGIKYDYGDLGDLVTQLANDPYTRQAYLPIFFPEDVGGGAKRAPCTLGYQFVMRNDRLDMTYYIRSCDMRRHFRDDIYLTQRLLLWVLKECQKINPAAWSDVEPGTFNMHITSLHVFANDWPAMFPAYAPPPADGNFRR